MEATFTSGLKLIEQTRTESKNNYIESLKEQYYPVVNIIVDYVYDPSLTNLANVIYERMCHDRLIPLNYELKSIFLVHIFSTDDKLAVMYVKFMLMLDNLYGNVMDIIDGGNMTDFKLLVSNCKDEDPFLYVALRNNYDHLKSDKPMCRPKLKRQLTFFGDEDSFNSWCEIQQLLQK